MESKDIRKQLLPLMFEMGRILKSESNREGHPLPSFLHIETMRFINEKGTPSMSEIADYLKVAPPTATSLINSFVADGVLERVTDPSDRRRVRLTLSPKGKEVLEKTMEIRATAFSRVISHLSEVDCKELIRLLTLITRPQ